MLTSEDDQYGWFDNGLRRPMMAFAAEAYGQDIKTDGIREEQEVAPKAARLLTQDGAKTRADAGPLRLDHAH
jgi:hypothetical protein